MLTKPSSVVTTERFRLGDWRVDPSSDEVENAGQTYKLEPRAMRLLCALAQAGGKVVSAEALLQAVWPGLLVTQSSLYDAVAQLRKILGPQHIATVPRKGYRLSTTAEPVASAPAAMPIAISTPGSPDAQGLGPRSIAVLPFRTYGLPETLSFLRERLTDGLISAMSRQPGLVLVASGTMLTFREDQPPPQEVSRQLGARFVISGMLEAQGDMLFLSMQVADGWSGTQTFADELELPLNAWHEAVARVVSRLARALNFELNDLAARAVFQPGDSGMQALALSAQAWVALFARAQTRESNAQATKLAKQALTLAPNLAQAWMCKGYCEWRAGQYGWNDELYTTNMERALASVERAAELDPRDPDAYYVLGVVSAHHGQVLRAEEALHHCLRLTSSYAPTHAALGMVRLRRGYAAEAAAHCDRAFELSPREPLRAIWHNTKSGAALVMGDSRTAFEEAQRGIAVNPLFPRCYMNGVAAAMNLGNVPQAHAWVAVLRERTMFNSLYAIRTRFEASYAPVPEQLTRLLGLLGEAGMPER